MSYKKRITVLIIFFILVIQILLFINNRQKTSFKYFTWQIEEVSIGRLISISFISGLLMSFILNKTLNNNVKTYSKDADDENIINDNNYSSNSKYNNELDEIPPERDLRDPQPTISVNYRVIKENYDNDLRDKNQKSKKSQYDDDWNNNDSGW